MRILFLSALVLLLGSLAFAQVATIDTRGQQPTGPEVSITQGTGASAGGGAGSKVLELKLTIPLFTNLIVGDPFDYELLITNKSGKPIQLPQSVAWSDIDDGTEREQHYQWLDASFDIFGGGTALGVMSANLVLYGKPSNPATMVTLKPGDSLRILASANFQPAWSHPPEQGMDIHLIAYVAVNSARLRPRNAQADTYRSDEVQVYWARSQSEQIMFQVPQ